MGHEKLAIGIFMENNGLVDGDIEQNGKENAKLSILMVVEHHQLMPLQTLSSTYVMNDISKGLESVAISVINEVDSELRPAFHYMPCNTKFDMASVSFSLARVHAPSTVKFSLGCLVEEDFLEECRTMTHDPLKQSLFKCKDCPLKGSKPKDDKEGCEGHLVRKFIKECWWNCNDFMMFKSPKRKGWDLHTLEHLLKGTFVCEFAGEILTIKELYKRVTQTSNSRKYEFPVLLDADWETRVKKANQALCLDAGYNGNVSWYINHCCYDPNLVGISVEVEIPEHHYYHFASSHRETWMLLKSSLGTMVLISRIMLINSRHLIAYVKANSVESLGVNVARSRSAKKEA